MGARSSTQRQRPSANDQSQPPYPYSQATATGPYFLTPARNSAVYNPAYQNNGQYYGSHLPRPPLGGPGTQPYNRPQSAQGADKQLEHTAIIRNPVNVKKSTIAVTATADDPDKLIISFQLDASAPCLATAFVAAVEDTKNDCRITPSKQRAAPGVRLEKGLGLNFQKAGVEAAQRAWVDRRAYEETELLGVTETAAGQQYPLIIRLETITDEGLAEGHSLSELTPGGPQKSWMQSQTTFAQLVKDEDGGFKIRPLKQKIWVKGLSYELQEIYGIEQGTAAAKEREGVATGTVAADQEEERICVICMVSPRDTTVLPCRHMCMCHECAQEVRQQTSKCPICRNHVEQLLHIRMVRQQASQNPVSPSRQQAPKLPTTAARQPGQKSGSAPADQSAVAAAFDKLGLKGTSDKPK